MVSFLFVLFALVTNAVGTTATIRGSRGLFSSIGQQFSNINFSSFLSRSVTSPCTIPKVRDLILR